MAKPKKKRRKAYRPRDVFTPAILHDFLKGNRLTEIEFGMLDAIMGAALDKVHLMSLDIKSFRIVDTCCQQLYVLSSLFDGTEDNQRLSIFARCALQALWSDVNKTEDKRIIAKRLDFLRVLVSVLEHVQQLLKTMYAECTHVELARMEALLEKVPPVRFSGGWMVDPSDGEAKEVIGKRGTTFMHGRAALGKLVQIDGTFFWSTDNETLIRINEPILIVLE